MSQPLHGAGSIQIVTTQQPPDPTTVSKIQKPSTAPPQALLVDKRDDEARLEG